MCVMQKDGEDGKFGKRSPYSHHMYIFECPYSAFAIPVKIRIVLNYWYWLRVRERRIMVERHCSHSNNICECEDWMLPNPTVLIMEPQEDGP